MSSAISPILQKSYECGDCGKDFKTSSELRKHEITHSTDEPYKCGVCEKSFKTAPELRTHLQATHNTHKCGVCGKVFKSTHEIRNHKQIHSTDKPYKCNVCEKAFKYLSYLQVHERIHFDDRPYKCGVCGKAFKFTGELRMHERTHSNDKPYKCGNCGKAFNRLSHLQSHKLIHTNDTPYKCGVCGKTFKSTVDLRMHARTHSNAKPYKCGNSGKTFKRLLNLHAHEQIHSNDRSYKCRVCGKVIKSKQNLRIHEQTHSTDMPYKCGVCGKAFIRSSHLHSHEPIHSNDRPYKCGICGKVFKSTQELRKHTQLHPPDKPYKCGVCGKVFKSTQELRKHTQLHPPDKPYKCGVCGKVFKSTHVLQAHKRSHSNDKPYKCSICRKCYKTSLNFQKHKQKKHVGGIIINNSQDSAFEPENNINKQLMEIKNEIEIREDFDIFVKQEKEKIRAVNTAVHQTTHNGISNHNEDKLMIKNAEDFVLEPDNNINNQLIEVNAIEIREDFDNFIKQEEEKIRAVNKVMNQVIKNEISNHNEKELMIKKGENSVLEPDNNINNQLIEVNAIEIREDFDIFIKQEEEKIRAAITAVSQKSNNEISNHNDVEMLIKNESFEIEPENNMNNHLMKIKNKIEIWENFDVSIKQEDEYIRAAGEVMTQTTTNEISNHTDEEVIVKTEDSVFEPENNIINQLLEIKNEIEIDENFDLFEEKPMSYKSS